MLCRSRADVFRTLQNYLVIEGVEETSVHAMTEETTVEELGLDSLSLLNIGVEMEHEYGKQMDDRMFLSYKKLGDIVSWICN